VRACPSCPRLLPPDIFFAAMVTSAELIRCAAAASDVFSAPVTAKNVGWEEIRVMDYMSGTPNALRHNKGSGSGIPNSGIFSPIGWPNKRETICGRRQWLEIHSTFPEG
jgi:hypothetical protein